MDININTVKGISILAIKGRLDTTNYNQLELKLQDLMDKNNTRFIINCSEMSYISSSGLRVFLMYLKKISAVKGEFVICCLRENIQEIFKISGFNKIFRIYENTDDAINKLAE